MIFPFTIKYTKRLQSNVSPSDTEKVMTFIKDYIENKTAEDIEIDGNQLTYKASMFGARWNTNIFVATERGKFNLIEKNGNSVLTYEFFMYRMFVIVSLMSIVMGTVSHEPWFGFVCFAWLGGMNWIIALIRHKSMLGNIAIGIDTSIANGSFEKQESNTVTPTIENIEISTSSKAQIFLFYTTLALWTTSLIVHLCSIGDIDLLGTSPFVMLLHVGIFIVIISAIFILREADEIKTIRNNPWAVIKTIFKGTPAWLIAIAVLGFFYATINFSMFMSSQMGTPEIKDGQYILQEHGQFIKTITEKEYHHYQANIVRGFSGHWIAFYGLALLALYPFKSRVRT